MNRQRPMLKAQSFDCGSCMISYVGVAPGCPLCRSRREVEQMRRSIQELRNRLDVMTDDLNRARRDSDVLHALAEARELLGDDDRAFLKTVLYQWRDGKRIGALKVFHVGERQSAGGFMVIPRVGEPWNHTCTSMGGMGIASIYEEEMRASGPAAAMQTLARGLSDLLPGGSAAP